MKKKLGQILLIVCATMVLSVPMTTAVASEDHHPHRKISEEQMVKWTSKGLTKSEVYKSNHIAHFSGHSLEEVITYYLDHDRSFELTKKEFGLDGEKHKKMKEKFLKEHKEEIIKALATYLALPEEKIKTTIDEKVSLRFLVKAAPLIKAPTSSFDEVIQLKRDGASFKEIKEKLKIDDEQLSKEHKAFKKEIRKLIG